MKASRVEGPGNIDFGNPPASWQMSVQICICRQSGAQVLAVGGFAVAEKAEKCTIFTLSRRIDSIFDFRFFPLFILYMVTHLFALPWKMSELYVIIDRIASESFDAGIFLVCVRNFYRQLRFYDWLSFNIRKILCFNGIKNSNSVLILFS